MTDSLQDLRHSLRSLLRSPVLTGTIVLTVGLGIGATSAIYAVIDSVLIQPLPYPDAGRLVRIYTDSPPHRWPLSVADYQALESQQTRFRRLAAYRNSTMTFHGAGTAERVRGKLVTWGYFPLLGHQPLHGRLPAADDDRPGAARTVVVSHRFWVRHLSGDPAAVGGAIRLDGRDFTLLGVLPPGSGPLEHDRDFFATAQWDTPSRKGPFFLTVLGLPHEGVQSDAALQELRSINARMFPVWQSSYQDREASWGLMTLKSHVIGDVATLLAVVLAAVGFVLLIACANAANLLVARVSRRGRELAVRSALGASKGRILRHLLAENLILAGAAGPTGLVCAAGALELVRAAGGAFLPRTAEIALGGRSLAFLAAVALGGALLFGLPPALAAVRWRLDLRLAAGGRFSTDGAGFRRALVAAQFAVAAPLLIAAALLLASLTRLQSVDPGFDPNGVLTVAVFLPAALYPEPQDVTAFRRDALRRVQALPGVEGAAFADSRPPAEVWMINNFELEDKPTPDGQSQPAVPWVAVTPEYFATLGIPLLQGRLLEEGDAEGPPAVVVDRAWAQRFYPGEEVLGKRFQDGGCTTCTPNTVVGVVGVVKYVGLDKPDEGTVYWPLETSPSRDAHLMVRTAGPPGAVLPAIRTALRKLDPALPVSADTLDEVIADSLDSPRYLALLVGAFATLALLLSVVGIYGTMSFFVQQHTRDIGIRMALGATRTRVLESIVGRGLRLAGLGLAAGVAAGLFLTRYLSSLLFQVGATDPLTFVAVPLLMLTVALAACSLPAWRAAAIDPARTLREE